MAPYDLEIRFGTIYGHEEEEMALKIIRENAPTCGNYCLEFEKDFAQYIGCKYARTVTNGTSALFLSMLALGVGRGTRVLTTPITWIATAAAAATLGAEVDFVDVDKDTYNMDMNQVEANLTENTKVVAPVHLYGLPCDMDTLQQLADKYSFSIVEDACHAIGAEYKGKKTGNIGALGCFSFHEQKNMSTLGEGGMVTTSDPNLFERVSLYRSHATRVYAPTTKYCLLDENKFPKGKRFWWQDFDDCAYNFRMTDIQAGVGIIQLKKLDGHNRKRKENAEYLTQALKTIPGIITPTTPNDRTNVFHLYPIRIVPEEFGLTKEDLLWIMKEKYDIKLGIHYIPLHWSTAFQKRGFKRGQFPIAEELAETLVTLPVHPRLTHEAMDFLVDALATVSKEARDNKGK
ncbi:MAG TPA: DegT/DnrJ/EryC1/StrS family aminotransferase [Candidatus Hydrogenedens sp.]|nr:DegT/DnrJ/EryC1/StrS family aminotransferase [Candidatus Hydrogenedens sp.]